MKRVTEIIICILVIVGVAFGIKYGHIFVTDYFASSYAFSKQKKGIESGRCNSNRILEK